jgi:CheY-like chemotaxis protein
LPLPEGQVEVLFAISDTGIGIPADKHSSIFDTFSQADGSTTRRFGGSGLGLAISSTLVKLMGGRITVESRPGEGSIFQFTVPFNICGATAPDIAARTTSQSARPATPTAARPLKILLAEDNVVNQRVAVGLLEKRGHRLTIANNGHEACAALGRETFDLVLMDVQMPEMDGFEATGVIRAAERATGRHVRILAMTAHAMAGDRERCLEAGMDGYIAKPLNLATLVATVEGCAPSTLEASALPPTAQLEGLLR